MKKGKNRFVLYEQDPSASGISEYLQRESRLQCVDFHLRNVFLKPNPNLFKLSVKKNFVFLINVF